MSDSERRNTDRYWKREETALGRAFNDVMDGARELANRVQYVLPGRTQSEREMFQRAIREDREEKQWTREHYKQTGRMETRDEIAANAHYSSQRARTPYEARLEREIQNALGGGEREAAQVRERLDYQLRHPGPGEIAERHADLAGDATVDRSQIDKIIRQEVEQAKNPVFDRWTTGADYEKALEAQQAQQKFVYERAHAAEQGWRPNEHPEDPHYHERFGNREPSLSREIVGGRQILPFVDTKENRTMDSEVKAAKEHVRGREQERWNRVEQIGRQAIDADRARMTEKPTATTEADLATKAERQRPQTA